MSELFKKSITWAFGVISVIFTFVPENVFGLIKWVSESFIENCKEFGKIETEEINVIITRVLCFVFVWIIVTFGYGGYLKIRRKVTIKGDKYKIKICRFLLVMHRMMRECLESVKLKYNDKISQKLSGAIKFLINKIQMSQLAI